MSFSWLCLRVRFSSLVCRCVLLRVVCGSSVRCSSVVRCRVPALLYVLGLLPHLSLIALSLSASLVVVVLYLRC